MYLLIYYGYLTFLCQDVFYVLHSYDLIHKECALLCKMWIYVLFRLTTLQSGLQVHHQFYDNQ